MQVDLKKFNPTKISKVETNMWEAYYKHNFFMLFVYLLQLAHEQFQISYFYALKISYPSASAAIHFRSHRGHEDKDLLQYKLEKFYKSINNIVNNKFDYKKAAELEVDWWLVDRYPNKYQITRREALRDCMACIYNVNSEELTEYAEYRAQAMEVQDEAEAKGLEADWNKINSLLLISYNSLYNKLNI